MPTPSERMDRLADLIRTHYRDDLDLVFTITRRLTGKRPEQANNEIRNGLNHMARALAEADSDAAKGQFKKAEDHLDRAKRDCLKIAVVQLHTDLWRAITDIEIVDGRIDGGLRAKMRRWQHGRLSVGRAECRGESDIGIRLMQLVNDGIDLKREIQARHRVPSRLRTWLHGKRPRVRAVIKEAMSVIGGALVAGAILFLYHHFAKPDGIPSHPAAPAPAHTAGS